MNVSGLLVTKEPQAFNYLALSMALLAIVLLVTILWKKWF
jgi:hypothetical protein